MAETGAARLWFLFAIGSLVLAGLLSLTLVVGRLPGMGWLFTDPLFFKRALVVHVDLAMVVWFQAGTAAFLAFALGAVIPRAVRVVAGLLAFTGVLGLLAGAVMPGAQPILANYVPVIDHPVFIAGLACWFAGTGLFFAGALAAPAGGPGALPDDALVALRASANVTLGALTLSGAGGLAIEAPGDGENNSKPIFISTMPPTTPSRPSVPCRRSA